MSRSRSSAYMASGRGEGRQRQAVGGQAGPRGWAANLHHIELVGGRGLVQHHLISNQRDDATLSIYLHVISLVAHLVQRRLARQLVRRDRVDPTVQQPTDEGHVPWLWPAACLASPPSPFLPTHEHTVCMDGGGGGGGGGGDYVLILKGMLPKRVHDWQKGTAIGGKRTPREAETRRFLLE